MRVSVLFVANQKIYGESRMSAEIQAADKSFFGHPKGLQTLFMTEMWERMSYYGMRGLLVLFMTAAITDGGLAITTATAVAIYGLYTAAVYFMGLPGGWIADRLIGSQKAIWYGGITIMCGHIVLAIPNHTTFFLGLILVILGTGLLKPNISAVVGQLYGSKDERRDSGYAIYYMGINIGSLIGYTVCGLLAEKVGWHWGFGAAAVGMAFGLIHFWRTSDNLRGAGDGPAAPLSAKGQKTSWMLIWAGLLAIAIVTAMMMMGKMTVDPIALTKKTAIVFSILFFVYYFWIYFTGNLNNVEKRGMWALLLVCIASTCFWSGFEQAGSSLNLFGQDLTDRRIFGWEMPTTWLQNANPFFIIVLTPFFAAMWIRLGQKLVTPAYGLKCAVGLIIMGLGFVVMYFAAIAAAGGKVAIFWLILTYFLHTVGELCLSPIALSAISKLSPKRFMAQLMGLFIFTYSMGNIIASLFAGNYDSENVAEMPGLFMQIAIFVIGAGAIALLIGMFTKGWEKDVEVANADSDSVF